MSRSYKKNAIIKDKNKLSQKLGNRKLRRKGKRIESEETMPSKKNEVINQYDVSDWKFVYKKRYKGTMSEQEMKRK